MIRELFLAFLAWTTFIEASLSVQLNQMVWSAVKINSDYIGLDLTPFPGKTLITAAMACQKMEKCKVVCSVNGEYQLSEEGEEVLR